MFPFWTTWGPNIGPKFKKIANLSCNLSQLAREGYSPDEKNIFLIGDYQLRKFSKNYQLGQVRRNALALVLVVFWIFSTSKLYSDNFFYWLRALLAQVLIGNTIF